MPRRTAEIKKHISASFSNLIFDEKYHIYTNKVTGMKYPPVTRLVEGHADPFNAEAMLPYSAKKEGMTVDELRRKWSLINTTALDIGTNTHEFLEKFNGSQTPSNGYEEAGIKFLKFTGGRYTILFKELRMYSRKYSYAGTTDLVFENVESTDVGIGNSLSIGDYKTNGDLFKSYGFLRPPFEYLESSPFNKYQLQLSYYQIMLEDIGYTIKDRIIVHLKAIGEYRLFYGYDFTKELRKHMGMISFIAN